MIHDILIIILARHYDAGDRPPLDKETRIFFSFYYNYCSYLYLFVLPGVYPLTSELVPVGERVRSEL